MNAVMDALRQAKFQIPKRLLELAFVYRGHVWRAAPQNIDEAIRNMVIRPRVIIDTNLVGGTETWVYLQDVPYERTDDYTQVYRIPKKHTQNRSILSVLNVTFTDPMRGNSFGVAAGYNNSTTLQAGQAVMDAYAQIPITSTHKVQLIGENVVMLRDSTILPPNIYLRCVLGNDENMTHLQVRTYPMFAKLVLLAIKAFIYNSLVIEVDIGELQGGQVIGKIKEILDSYADANEQYTEYLLGTFGRVEFMNDNETYTRFLKLQIGSYR